MSTKEAEELLTGAELAQRYSFDLADVRQQIDTNRRAHGRLQEQYDLAVRENDMTEASRYRRLLQENADEKEILSDRLQSLENTEVPMDRNQGRERLPVFLKEYQTRAKALRSRQLSAVAAYLTALSELEATRQEYGELTTLRSTVEALCRTYHVKMTAELVALPDRPKDADAIVNTTNRLRAAIS